MATCSTGSIVAVGVPSNANNANMRFQGNSWSQYSSANCDLYTQYGINSVFENDSYDTTGVGTSGSWSRTVGASMVADENYQFQAHVVGFAGGSPSFANGGIVGKKTNAVAPTFGAPAVSNITSSTATLDCDFYTNVLRSSAVAQFQYKKTADIDWIDGGSGGGNGYNIAHLTKNISGLAAATQYQVRLVIFRSTESDPVVVSGVTTSFTTLAGAPQYPLITTEPVTDITHSSAITHGILTHNGFDGYFVTPIGFNNPPDEGAHVNSEYVFCTTSGYKSSAVTGLSPSTTYYARSFYVYNNGTIATAGATIQFTTLAAPAIPDITTSSATAIEDTTVDLAGIVNPNGVSTQYWIEYGPTTGYGTETTHQGPSSASAPFSFSAHVTGLTASSLYHYRAVALTNGVHYYGTDATFTTAATPEAVAAEEEHMQTIQFDGTYGVAKTVTFSLRKLAATSSNLFYTGTAPIQADTLMWQDGVAMAPATSDNAPAQSSTYLYTLVVSAAEMSAEVVDIIIHSADTGTRAFRDAHIQVRTKQRLGQLIVDATNITDGDALALTKNGTGKALKATGDIYTSTNLDVGGNVQMAGDLSVGDDVLVGDDVTVTGTISATDISGIINSLVLRAGTAQAGAAGTITLDSGASATDNYYNNAVVAIYGGTGNGQSRIITAYNGTTKVATVNSSWAVNPSGTSTFVLLPGSDVWGQTSTELASIPTATDSYGKKLQFLFQRFCFRRNQTATVHTMFKADNTTTLDTAAVSDNGTVQEFGRLEP